MNGRARPLLAWNLVSNYLAQGWVALVGLLFVPVYIAHLGIEAYGIIGVFALLQTLPQLLDFGMTATLGREMARFGGDASYAARLRDLLRSIEIISAALATLVALGLLAASPWLATSWLRPGGVPAGIVADALAIIGVVTAMRFVEGVYRATLIGLQRQVRYNVISSAVATIRAIGAIGVLTFVSNTIVAFFVWQGIVSVVSVMALLVATYGALPRGRAGRFSKTVLRGSAGFAFGMLGITLLALLLTQADKILLSNLLTLTQFGHYTLATAVASLLVTLVGPIIQAVSPRLAQLHATGDGAGFATLYHQAAQFVSVAGGTAAAMLIVFADTLLRLWTRDAPIVSETTPVLQLLALGSLMNVVALIPYQAQLAHGWTGLVLRINTVAVLLIVPALWWVVPRYGSIGAAATWAGLNAGYVLILAQFMHRRILPGEKARWYVQDVVTPLIGPWVVAVTVRFLVPVDVLPVWGQALVLGLAGSVALGAAGLGSHYVRIQVNQIVRRQRHS